MDNDILLKPPGLKPDPLKKTFLKLLNDWAFKHVFASKKHPGNLIRLLNAIFEDEFQVTDVEYKDREIQPEREDGKKLQYDIYCTTDTGHHFIIEMQQEESENFPNRMLYYVCRSVVDQGVKGVEYELVPVYCVVLTDFNMTGKEVRLMKDYLLMERGTHEVYTEGVRLIFLALPEVPKEWEECNTTLLRLLYIIKNSEHMNKESKAYRSGEFDDIFEAAEVSRLEEPEATAYSQSYLADLEHESALRFAAKKGLKEGIGIGREEGIGIGREEGIGIGREEGKKEGFNSAIAAMIENGATDELIRKFTGITPENLAKIRNSLNHQ